MRFKQYMYKLVPYFLDQELFKSFHFAEAADLTRGRGLIRAGLYGPLLMKAL